MKHKVPVKRAGLWRLIYAKYLLGEIDFFEFKDRIRAASLLSEWVEDYIVVEKAYNRFNKSGAHFEQHFLDVMRCGNFRNIDSTGIQDWPIVEEFKPRLENP